MKSDMLRLLFLESKKEYFVLQNKSMNQEIIMDK